MSLRYANCKRNLGLTIHNYKSASKRFISYLSFFIISAVVCTACVNDIHIFNGIINAKAAWFILWLGVLTIVFVIGFVLNGCQFKTNSLDIAVVLFLTY